MTELLINPPPGTLGRANVLLSARARRHEMHAFTGPLSIKSVIHGAATWETRDGRFELVPGATLVLNDGEEYSIRVDALQPVETFCVFFARGFVEDAFRAATTPSAPLLDSGVAPPVGFCERLHFDAPLLAALRTVSAQRDAESIDALAMQLVRAQCDVDSRVSRLPALRASTRAELARRVGRGVSFLHASLDRPVTVAEAAAEACLSPFHFHRLFAAMHGVTPHRYLARLRLERARMLLRSTTRGIADVARDCGFESLGTFTTWFTKQTGMPPGRFRRNEEASAPPSDLRLGA